MRVLVTGNAGFIGFHVARALMRRGDDVVGADVVNDYYSVDLKEARLRELVAESKAVGAGYEFHRVDLADPAAVDTLFAGRTFDRVIHLAAQAGVRYSLQNPRAYIRSNVDGFINILEACRHAAVPHLTYASSSSVYGANTAMPFSEHRGVDHPLSLYAATKRSNELMAHCYSHLFQLPTTGLRFFTVYGPWGRPDMALFLFTRSILAGQPVNLFNNGQHVRDFTYIDDIVEGVIRTSDRIAPPNPDWEGATPDPATSAAPFRVYNIGNNAPVQLLDYIEAIETTLGRKAIRNLMPLQPGDVPNVHADVSELERNVGYRPATPVQIGVARFLEWYRAFYGS